MVMPEVQNIQLGNLYCFPCNGTLHLCSWASNKNDEESDNFKKFFNKMNILLFEINFFKVEINLRSSNFKE